AWKPWFDPPQIFSPRLRRSARTASMPFLSIVRRPLVETRSFTQRFSDATQKRRSWRLGMKRRRVLFIACETLLPVVVRLPVTWQTRDMVHLRWVAEIPHGCLPWPGKRRPRRLRGYPCDGARCGRGAAGVRQRCQAGPESRFRVGPLPPLRAGGTQRAEHYRQNSLSRQPVGRGHAPDAPRAVSPRWLYAPAPQAFVGRSGGIFGSWVTEPPPRPGFRQ